MPDNLYVTAQQLLDDAFELGMKVMASNFRPDLLVGVWRGGAPVAIAIHELMTYLGLTLDHIPIRTQLYRGIDARHDRAEVEGLDYVVRHRNRIRRILLVDDVFDTGLSLHRVVQELHRLCEAATPDIRIATPWYKPLNNRTPLRPDYHLHETSAWLVFPHELCGLSRAELLANKPGIDRLRQTLLATANSGAQAVAITPHGTLEPDP